MGLDLWFREDVARILASTLEAMSSSQAVGGGNADYQQGVEDALRAVGVAFGVLAPRSDSVRTVPRLVEGECPLQGKGGEGRWNGRSWG
jgi:hypothetical protein